MELYIYETSAGNVADFRPYLDGHDHSFDDHRPLVPGDPRWEKISGLRDPVDRVPIGELRFIGKSSVEWKELMMFPLRWEGEFEPEDWEDATAESS